MEDNLAKHSKIIYTYALELKISLLTYILKIYLEKLKKETVESYCRSICKSEHLEKSRSLSVWEYLSDTYTQRSTNAIGKKKKEKSLSTTVEYFLGYIVKES